MRMLAYLEWWCIEALWAWLERVQGEGWAEEMGLLYLKHSYIKGGTLQVESRCYSSPDPETRILGPALPPFLDICNHNPHGKCPGWWESPILTLSTPNDIDSPLTNLCWISPWAKVQKLSWEHSVRHHTTLFMVWLILWNRPLVRCHSHPLSHDLPTTTGIWSRAIARQALPVKTSYFRKASEFATQGLR